MTKSELNSQHDLRKGFVINKSTDECKKRVNICNMDEHKLQDCDCHRKGVKGMMKMTHARNEHNSAIE